MNDTLDRSSHAIAKAPQPRETAVAREHIVEVISDSGEGAQRCGQSLGAIAARMGNGIWTPRSSRPRSSRRRAASPARAASASGSARSASPTAATRPTSSWPSTSRCCSAACAPASSSPAARSCSRACGASTAIRRSSRRTSRRSRPLAQRGYRVYEVPLERECRALVADPRARQEHVRARHAVQHLQPRPEARRASRSRSRSARRTRKVIASQRAAARRRLRVGRSQSRLQVPHSRPCASTEPQIVVNGNTALALGVLASGMDICAMYPITPATSASHYLSDVFEKVGGIVHQAEDEIAACAFAIGASYAGKCAVTITSGPGYSLKQEAIGLAVMARDPARRRQRAARRPEHGPADQGRAGRSARRRSSAATATRPRS